VHFHFLCTCIRQNFPTRCVRSGGLRVVLETSFRAGMLAVACQRLTCSPREEGAAAAAAIPSHSAPGEKNDDCVTPRVDRFAMAVSCVSRDVSYTDISEFLKIMSIGTNLEQGVIISGFSTFNVYEGQMFLSEQHLQ
jgi:hypothetical protein